MNDIVKIDNAVASKATTENSGGAFVEYSLDITFKSQDMPFTTKLTAYTTSCRLMFQLVGGSTQAKVPPGNKFIPRYFVDTFLLPWCEDAYAKKNYDEEEILEAIRCEMKILDVIKCGFI